jgi:CelD/BcsL family acetyltransferase involved in cellulose biosynthesis
MSEPMKAFFWDVVTATIPGWETNLCFLKINDIPAAGVITFESEIEVWLYNSGYDPQFASYSVGLLLKAHKIKKAIEAGKKKYDFLRGAERYKYDLGAKDLQLYRIEINQ